MPFRQSPSINYLVFDLVWYTRMYKARGAPITVLMRNGRHVVLPVILIQKKRGNLVIKLAILVNFKVNLMIMQFLD